MYDVIVIGGGPGGYTAALETAKRGKRVAVIERKELGGTCLNAGCVPVKALLRAAKAYDAVKKGGMGVLADSPRVDITALRLYQDETMEKLREGLRRAMKAGKVEVIAAEGKVVAEGLVAAGGKLLVTKNIVVATGGAPAMPPIVGAERDGVITSDDLLKYEKPINRLTIVGGGVVGCEFAYMYACLGAEVTIIEGGKRLLPSIGDREVSQNLALILKKRGVNVFLEATADEIVEADGGLAIIHNGAETRADAALIAVGRKSDARKVFAAEVNVNLDASGAIETDALCRTNIPGIYAVGDITSGSRQLAHAAYAAAKVAAADICGDKANIVTTVIPACVYTEPEIACVGVSMDEAKERGLTIRKSLTSGNAKSVIDDQARGFVKFALDSGGRLLGASLMCGRASDLVGELALAIANNLTEADIAKTVHPHPSYSETIWEAVDA